MHIISFTMEYCRHIYTAKESHYIRSQCLDCMSCTIKYLTIPITITNYLFKQNQTRNMTKVILKTHEKKNNYNVRAEEIALKTSWQLAYIHLENHDK